eukprot:TRINITY_DN1163_c0_g1_i1.p1 TRINITY_DN1163_c0_g1~~TRINITY_DN1163_c0_g1_i1.p1  ORF type:complete len:164 (-),score=43.84 TRINITY_DN1163_c0_g1_i1:36-527(-)
MYHLSSGYHTISSDFQLQRRISAEPSDTLIVLVTIVKLKRRRQVEEQRQEEMEFDPQPAKKAKVSRVRWTASEVHLLTKAVERIGDQDWEAIALRVPTRTDSQCRLKWRDLQAKDSLKNSAVSSIADLSRAQAAMFQVLLMNAQQQEHVAEQNRDEAKQEGEE